MIKAYFFDWTGTLGYVENKGNIQSILTRPQHNSLLTHSFEEANIPDDIRSTVYDSLIQEQHKLYPDSQETIESLKQDYKLAIVSNKYNITATMLERFFSDFLQLFDTVTFSSQVGYKKPDPRIFLHTLTNLNKICGINILPSEVMMIGNKKEKDEDPALELGMQARLCNRPKLIDIVACEVNLSK